MDPRLAKSLDVLRSQVNAAFPARDKSSDGWIGDARHQAEKSEHNPDPETGVVRALDLTNDPAHGVNARQIAQALLDSRDDRILYVISNREMARSYPKAGTTPWQWSPYTGKNAHDHHSHVSVVPSPIFYDDPRPWKLSVLVPSQSKPSPAAPEPAAKVYRNIIATVFGGRADPNNSAYDGLPITDDELGGALPFHFTTVPRRDVWAQGVESGKSAILKVRDVGPIYPHKDRGPADPYWLTDSRPRAETMRIMSQAGIDLAPAAARALGIDGKGLVNWSFVTPRSTPATPPVTPKKDIPVTDPVAAPVNPLAAVEHVAEFILPLVAKSVPQIAPFIPVIEGLILLIGDIINAKNDPLKILAAVGDRLHAIGTNTPALPALAPPVDVQGRTQ